MFLRRMTAVALVTMLAAPPFAAAGPSATLQGSVESTKGQPLSNVPVSLLNLDTGKTLTARTNASGAFQATLDPGTYALDTAGTGYEVVRGPRVVALAAGQVATAALFMMRPAQDAGGFTQVGHPAQTCFIADRHPVLTATVTPAPPKPPNVYFHSALGTDWYYVEMVPSANGYVGRLPRPRLDAGPITYYIEALGARTGEITARVVERDENCADRDAGAPVLVNGPAVPPPGFTGISGMAGAAAGGGVATAASVGGGISSTALLIGGAAVLAGIGIAIAVSGDDEPASPSR